MPIDPHQHVAHFPAGVFDGAHQAMKGPGAAKGQEMGAGLGYAQGLDPEGGAGDAAVPILAHEAEAIWRIGDDGVEGIGG